MHDHFPRNTDYIIILPYIHVHALYTADLEIFVLGNFHMINFRVEKFL